jgi:hypothetical protein
MIFGEGGYFIGNPKIRLATKKMQQDWPGKSQGG